MKAFLLYQDRDVPPTREPTASEQALTQDLELGPLWAAMAAGDDFLAGLAQRVMLAGLTSPEAITYRQQILADAVARPAVIRQLYDLAGAAITGEKKVFFGLMSNSPDSQLFRAVKVLELFRGLLRQLRAVADDQGAGFQSPGFRRFFTMIAEELDDAYLQTVDGHLKQLACGSAPLTGAGLGGALKGTGSVLRQPHPAGWRERWSLGSKDG